MNFSNHMAMAFWDGITIVLGSAGLRISGGQQLSR
jgi:hypothetical protein